MESNKHETEYARFTDSVIRVGDGRGFVFEHRTLFYSGHGYRWIRRKVVVTASHCLPHPPKMPCYSYEETTYANLLAPLGKKPSVWAQCLFFEPVADVAVLDEPDNQELSDESEKYDRLLKDRKPLAIAMPESGNGYILARNGISWKPTTLEVHVTIGGIGLSIGPTLGGQSGSPILDGKGRAVALVSVGGETISNGVRTPNECGNGPQPILKLSLPPWLLKATKRKDEDED